uniref:Pre-mRNA polyadenylation factor Fip1 domain-containing protein n=1 Tax=Eptatretus burgeri TaxID=7764 RepID=A0A8C4WUU6_EPTBU
MLWFPQREAEKDSVCCSKSSSTSFCSDDNNETTNKYQVQEIKVSQDVNGDDIEDCYKEPDDDDDDDVQVTIGAVHPSITQYHGTTQIGSPVNFHIKNPIRSSNAVPKDKNRVDLDAKGDIGGLPVLEVNLDSFDDKPWRKPGADVSDYFNYGFNEDSWHTYCEKQKSLRLGRLYYPKMNLNPDGLDLAVQLMDAVASQVKAASPGRYQGSSTFDENFTQVPRTFEALDLEIARQTWLNQVISASRMSGLSHPFLQPSFMNSLSLQHPVYSAIAAAVATEHLSKVPIANSFKSVSCSGISAVPSCVYGAVGGASQQNDFGLARRFPGTVRPSLTGWSRSRTGPSGVGQTGAGACMVACKEPERERKLGGTSEGVFVLPVCPTTVRASESKLPWQIGADSTGQNTHGYSSCRAGDIGRDYLRSPETLEAENLQNISSREGVSGRSNNLSSLAAEFEKM